MIVRLRLSPGPPIRQKQGKNRHVAFAMASLLWPAVLGAYALGLWALGSQLRITAGFAISSGIFSHWQVWVFFGILLHLGAVSLNRYGRTGQLLRIRRSI